MQKPQSLAKLHDSVRDLSPMIDYESRYRVRNIRTLNDYLVLRVLVYRTGIPTLFQTLQLDWSNRLVELQGDEEMYTLLSTDLEIVWLSGMTYSFLISSVEKPYKDLDVFQCQFGEG